ncbi:hypothetical protein GCM10027034_44920 [Ramlibacter solisilvae]|uniref:Uncharacterized protein n=1 Tax=Ramlibacter tataouinensis TaxID=94132 RepID=A0A127JSW0_9BURK|nr:carotenoid biosynthesis protein [Ramlibacter tataouinensis]AMO23071.1 hypothetical protein UC35_09430 [Ramlibacter tataouinensis]
MSLPRVASVFGVFAILLLAWTAQAYPWLTVALVAASLALGAVSLWSASVLYGPRAAATFLALGASLGWFAEQTGSALGWFFGHYSYTDVLGPRLGNVPLVIPVMWFGLCHTGLLMANLLLWRAPVGPWRGWRVALLAALLAAMLVTAFDLGADPYFVYQLKAWVMAKKDGGWFGETVRGFEGWMVVSFAIVAAFLAARPPGVVPASAAARRAALAPVLLYAGLMLFQMVAVQPIALRVTAFFAMGIPALAAAVAWQHWARRPAEAAA